MKRQVIAFDLDGTLAPSKSPLPDLMAAQIDRLLEHYHVCVISGGKFEQFKKQVIDRLSVAPVLKERLHIMPTCGTRYMRFNAGKDEWEKIYAEDFTEPQKKEISTVLAKVVKDLGYEEKKLYGETIEDRGSQISWSALGQNIVDDLGLEGVRLKEEWDRDNKKKDKIREAAAALLPDFEVRSGGLTTIDITKPGIDKAYGMQKLMEVLGLGKQEILFIGDRLMEGGNDYPVKEFGIDTIEINAWEETALVIEGMIQTASS
jgi:HAD superfamily hydrolase (TIGR01484 family)